MQQVKGLAFGLHGGRQPSENNVGAKILGLGGGLPSKRNLLQNQTVQGLDGAGAGQKVDFQTYLVLCGGLPFS